MANRKLRLPWRDVSQALSTVLRLCPTCATTTPDLTNEAVRLAERYQFAFYDSMIVAAALRAGCTTLLSEDMHQGLQIEQQLTVDNPVR